MGKIKRLTPAQRQEVLARYQNGESSEALGKAYGVTGVAIRATIKRLGGTMRSASDAHRIYPHREDAFAEPTDEAAYWAGFLMADGCVSRPEGETPVVSIMVNDRDWDHVEKFRSFLRSDMPVRSKAYRGYRKEEGKAARWAIRSHRLADDLAQWGVVPRKSQSASASEQAVEMPAFWRGVVDGDGYVSRGNRCPLVSLTANFHLMPQFIAWASSVSPDYPFKATPAAGNSSTAVCCAHGKGAMDLLVALYRDAPVSCSLDRKREKALALLKEYENKEWRDLSGSIPTLFPWRFTSVEKARKDWKALCAYSPAITSDMKRGVLVKQIKQHSAGMYAGGYFSERVRMAAKAGRNAKSPLEAWGDPALKEKIIFEAKSRKHSSLRAALWANCRAAWPYWPGIAKGIYNYYGATEILDPCAGWGCRLVGAMSRSETLRYVGVDPNSQMEPVYARMINAYRPEFDGKVIRAAFEDVELEGTFDMVFTSPPYYNFEIYSDDPEQSSARYQSAQEWRERFLRPLFEKSIAHLHRGGTMAINISETKDHPLVRWSQEEAHRVGLMLREIITFQTGFARQQEPILVWEYLP